MIRKLSRDEIARIGKRTGQSTLARQEIKRRYAEIIDELGPVDGDVMEVKMKANSENANGERRRVVLRRMRRELQDRGFTVHFIYREDSVLIKVVVEPVPESPGEAGVALAVNESRGQTAGKLDKYEVHPDEPTAHSNNREPSPKTTEQS